MCIPCGALAQLGERLICIQEVIGSIPIGSTNPPRRQDVGAKNSKLMEKQNVRANFFKTKQLDKIFWDPPTREE